VSTLPELSAKFRAIWPHLDERTRRLTAASEAKALGKYAPDHTNYMQTSSGVTAPHEAMHLAGTPSEEYPRLMHADSNRTCIVNNAEEEVSAEGAAATRRKQEPDIRNGV